MKTDVKCDFLIVGSGFAGSLAAVLLQSAGCDVAVVDRARHPRFAIGESLTPLANRILGDLCRRFDIPNIEPLEHYGSWRKHYPQLGVGLKRGFSYFHHRPGQPFTADREHSTELLVAANGADEIADTHWYRADVDAFLAAEAGQRGIELWEGYQVESLQRIADGWQIKLVAVDTTRSNPQRRTVRAENLIDATGPAGVIAEQLQIDSSAAKFHTHSSAIYSHFRQVPAWQTILDQRQVPRVDYPFDCDHAALHHVLRRGWMWQLRFDDDGLSAGFVQDHRADGLRQQGTPDQDWCQLLAEYPSLQEQFKNSVTAAMPGRLIRSPRLQWMRESALGDGWLLLPHTFGFVDPLHSTGIGFTLWGLERFIDTYLSHGSPRRDHASWQAYESDLTRALLLVDRLVSACYLAIPDPHLFHAATMLYFAAATTAEQRRNDRVSKTFLCADDAAFCEAVESSHVDLKAWSGQQTSDASAARDVAGKIQHRLEPFNHVGLFSPEVPNMYRYTAVMDS